MENYVSKVVYRLKIYACSKKYAEVRKDVHYR